MPLVGGAAAAALAKRALESPAGKRLRERLEREAADRLADGVTRLVDRKRYLPKRGAPRPAGAKRKRAGGKR